MIGVVIASHGFLAKALLETAEDLLGKQSAVAVLCFETGAAPARLQAELLQAVHEVEQGQGVLVLVDLAGGSPYNASAWLACKGGKIEIVSGVNLSMLTEVLAMRNSQLDLLAQVAIESGCGGICRLQLPR
ncbi:PTS sugar transporter subunit IIA [Azotosporobacter soli]|uniref:PTS sugar transporter subunit IIA n=1 Tax=Azotosporobacter soli TaxID=3055040 RepID=UPI0031FE8FA6